MVNWLVLYPFNLKFKKKSTKYNILILVLDFKNKKMNLVVFWILFLGLWGIVPLMILKGRTDEKKILKTTPEIKQKKKGWFK